MELALNYTGCGMSMSYVTGVLPTDSYDAALLLCLPILIRIPLTSLTITYATWMDGPDPVQRWYIKL